jgi:hypothetical protein
MSRSFLWLLPVLVAVAALPCSAQGAARLSPTATRVLADGPSPVTYRATLTYDPTTGMYTRTTTDAATGTLVATETLDAPMIRPSADEEAAAQEIIATDAELASLIAASPYRVHVSGGFPLVREAGHACAPPARCLQYDVLQAVPGQRSAERLRYVVVDLRTLSLVSRDFDAATEGNLANPAIRAESRSR